MKALVDIVNQDLNINETPTTTTEIYNLIAEAKDIGLLPMPQKKEPEPTSVRKRSQEDTNPKADQKDNADEPAAKRRRPNSYE